MELKQKILEAAIVVFNQKGMKFTMDDLARQLEISKKTIYTVFLNKEELLYGMVDYMFDSIKESERAIVEDESLSLIEKIRSILVVLPAGYRELDFSQLYQLKEKYPNTVTLEREHQMLAEPMQDGPRIDLQTQTPEQLFRNFYEQITGSTLTEEELTVLEECFQQVREVE